MECLQFVLPYITLTGRLKKFVCAAGIALLAAGFVGNGGSASSETRFSLPAGEGFDYYVLALSWSPSYCAAEGDNANRQQCGAARRYGFIVHGLWPQFERGYPSNCATDRPLDVPRAEIQALYDIMPAAGLIRHQWKKHGTCSGLSRKDFFKTLRAARETITIPSRYKKLTDYQMVDPAAVEKAFLAENPGAKPDGIIVTCDKRYLREVRLCLTKSLSHRSCPSLERRSCRRGKVVMPPARGG